MNMQNRLVHHLVSTKLHGAQRRPVVHNVVLYRWRSAQRSSPDTETDISVMGLRPPRGVTSDVLTRSQQLSIIKVTIILEY